MSRITRLGFVLLLIAAFLPIADAQMGTGSMGRGMGAMMMLSGGKAYRTDDAFLRMEDAINISQRYMLNHKFSNVALEKIEEWEFNYYVVVKEASPSEYKAYQLIIDKWTGYVVPEPGPNTIWNWKYCWIMGSRGGGCAKHGKVNFTIAQATSTANDFLKQRFIKYSVMEVAGPPEKFYGYYCFDVKELKTGARSGMLSVNVTTGQVWYHTWHGRFIDSRQM